MNKKFIYLGISIILASLTIFFLNSYIKNEQQKILEIARRRGILKVVVAKEDIPVGTRLTENLLALANIPQEQREPGAFDAIENVIGKITAKDVVKGEQITSSFLRLPEMRSSLSLKTPEGKRAFTIPVDKISSIEGMIMPSDKVDIIGVFTFPGPNNITSKVVIPLLQNVLVLATGTEIERTAVFALQEKPQPYTTVTLALSLEEVALVSYALELGKIQLLLRSPLDTRVKTNIEPMTMEKLWEKLLGVTNTPPPPPPPSPKVVEIYKGEEKVVVEMGKEISERDNLKEKK